MQGLPSTSARANSSAEAHSSAGPSSSARASSSLMESVASSSRVNDPPSSSLVAPTITIDSNDSNEPVIEEIIDEDLTMKFFAVKCPVSPDSDSLLCDVDGAMTTSPGRKKKSAPGMKPMTLKPGPKNLTETFQWDARYLESICAQSLSQDVPYQQHIQGNFENGIVMTTSYTGTFTAEAAGAQLKHGVAKQTGKRLPEMNFVLYAGCDCSKVSERIAQNLTEDVKPLHFFKNVLDRLNVVSFGYALLEALYLRLFGCFSKHWLERVESFYAF